MLDLALDDDAQIDTGVTSGADPSEWDPIDVDDRGRVDTCFGNEVGDHPAGQPAPPACGATQP